MIESRNQIVSSNDDKREISTAKALYALEKVWFHNLKAALICANVSLLPTVYAKNEGPPKKPPPMKYKDLPLYDSPHYDYTRYIEDKERHPEQDKKLLQTYLFPTVKSVRRSWAESLGGLVSELCLIKSEIYAASCKQVREFKTYMRSPDNLAIRQATVAAGTVAGIYIGSGSRNIIKKLFFGTLGMLAAGALCFPKESDVLFRNASYHFAKLTIFVYNSTCGRDYHMREKLPCADEVKNPEALTPADRNVCNRREIAPKVN